MHCKLIEIVDIPPITTTTANTVKSEEELKSQFIGLKYPPMNVPRIFDISSVKASPNKGFNKSQISRDEWMAWMQNIRNRVVVAVGEIEIISGK